MLLREAELTKHYTDRKGERGTIIGITLPEYVYEARNKAETDRNLIGILNAELNKRLAAVEKTKLGISNNKNLGIKVFIPHLVYKDRKLPIILDSGNGKGTYYLVVAANDVLLTIYLTAKIKDEDVIETIKHHLGRERPYELEIRPPDAYTMGNAKYLIDIDGNEVIEKEEKPETQKASEESLPYEVKTDYRKGNIFNHKEYGPGTVVAAASGGKGGSSGVVDWIEVKYKKPFLKGGKLQDTRRFENIVTSAYFGKTLKKPEMSLQEEKSTCCGKCGHVHVKGTTCPKPYLTGKRHCSRRTNEMHTVDHDGPDEFHQVRADVEESYETEEFCHACLAEYLLEYEHKLEEAEYRGRKVTLGKPFLTPGGPKKRSVYVKNAKGNVVKVNFGDPNLRIKKSNPKRRKSFRARHKCNSPGPRWKARYWSCRAW